MKLLSISRDTKSAEVFNAAGDRKVLFFHGPHPQEVPDGYGFSAYGLQAYAPWLRVVSKEGMQSPPSAELLIENAPPPSNVPAAATPAAKAARAKAVETAQKEAAALQVGSAAKAQTKQK
jgi:hypothetical protein